MNAPDLIRLVFDEEAGPVVVFDLENPDQDIPTDISDLTGLPEEAGLVMSMDGYVYGVVVPEEASSTFSTCCDDEVTFVAVLETPVPESQVPDSIRIDVPLVGINVHSEEFFKLEDIFDAELVDPKAARSGSVLVEESDGDGGSTGGGAGTPPCDAPCREVAAVASEGREVSAQEGARGADYGRPSGDTAPDNRDEADSFGELNDAEILGPEPEGFAEFLQKPATFLTGEMWGAKDRRNTQDGDWKAVTMPWGGWIMGGEGNKNAKPWGFSRHPVGKNKAGASIVLGSSIDGARKANAMVEMYALGLDIDSGAKLDTVIGKIRGMGLFALIYTSHSHGRSGLEVKRDDVLRKLQITEDPTLTQVQEYLREHSKSRYEESFIAQTRIEESRHQTKDGVKIVLSTPPLDKFRIIFPLAEAVKLIDLAPTQKEALEVWEDKITGMAWEALGIHFDTSCTDPSRLFYTARHADGAEWDCAIVRGAALRFEDVPTYKKHLYTKSREKLNPFEMAGDESGVEKAPQAYSPSGRSLNDWHRHAKDRFMMATLLEDVVPDKIRHAGGEAQGHVHVECPFEHEHSSEGGTACMAIDAIDSQNEYWTWFCHHDSCQGRHKLQFLEEALNQGWFEEDTLFDEDGLYLLEPGEEEEEAPKEAPKDDAGEEITIEMRASKLNENSRSDEIEAFLKELFREGIDVTDKARVTSCLVENTVLGKRDIGKMWQKLERAQERLDAKRAQTGDVKESGRMMVEADFDLQVEFAGRRLLSANEKKPFMFQYIQDLATVRENSEGLPYIRFFDQNLFTHVLNNVAPFFKKQGDDGKVRVSTPTDVAKHLYADAASLHPPLKGLTNTPVFASSGKLIRKEGYDLDSNLFYHPATGLMIPEVSEAPSEEEVFEAKRLLIEELLGDFPIAALTREELVGQGLHGDGVPALTNLLAFFLLPFARELLGSGSVAPGLLITKPSPGSGASLLVDCYSIVTGGATASPLAIPKNDEEMGKTLAAVLIEGRSQVYFDNINNNVDSGELASAMTADRYSARVLGKTQTVSVPVRSTFIFTGNNVMMTGELIRRLVLANLDARLANPELRTGWRHTDIKSWATENRGELVWACLTLIANWIAKGRPEQQKAVLASYEDFCRKIGGVLECAGIGGFLENREELKEKALDTDGDDFESLVEEWWDNRGTKPIFTKGSEDDNVGLCELAGNLEISLPVRKERDIDGNMVYSSRGMGKLIAQNKDRIFVLEDGAEVTLRKDSKRTKRGFAYFLELNRKVPKSNV